MKTQKAPIWAVALIVFLVSTVVIACTSNGADRIPTVSSMAATIQAERFATSTASVATREATDHPERGTNESQSEPMDLQTQCTEQFMIMNAKGRYAENAMTDEEYARAYERMQNRGMLDGSICRHIWDKLDAN